MNNPFRNLVKKPARHEKGEIVVADSGNVKEVAKIMIGFEALLRETQSYMSKACANELFDSDLKDAMRQLSKQYMKDHNYYVPHVPDAASRPKGYRGDKHKFLGRYSDNPVKRSAVQVFGAFFFSTARG